MADPFALDALIVLDHSDGPIEHLKLPPSMLIKPCEPGAADIGEYIRVHIHSDRGCERMIGLYLCLCEAVKQMRGHSAAASPSTSTKGEIR